MVLRWHKPDHRKLSNEDEARAVLRKGVSVPGTYVIPYCNDSKEMASTEIQTKLVEGPNATLIVRASGPMSLGPFLGKWFVYTLVVGLIVGTVARAALGPGAAYLSVFQVVGAASWLAYAWQSPQHSIWWGQTWTSTLRYMVDGLVYAALTAGAFSWLWPR
jgi:hypothetical protein